MWTELDARMKQIESTLAVYGESVPRTSLPTEKLPPKTVDSGSSVLKAGQDHSAISDHDQEPHRANGPLPKSVTGLVRYAIQLDPQHITVPTIKKRIIALGQESASKVSTGTGISTSLWGLANKGELVVAEKIPGGASRYAITEQFQPWKPK